VAIHTQTRGPGCGSSADWGNWEDALEEDLITARPTPYASLEDPTDIPTLILACFGFTIPLTATILSVEITKFLVLEGTTAQTWEIAQTRDASTPISPSTTKSIASGSSYLDLATFDMPGSMPSIAQANGSGFGVIITTTKPPMGQTGAGLDYMEITITYDDNVVDPVVLSGIANDGVCNLTWTESESATGYRLERSLAEGGPYASVYAGTDLEYADTGRTNGVTYWYRCYGTKGLADSDVSNIVSLTPEAPAGPPSIEVWIQAGEILELRPKPSYMTAGWTEVEDATEYALQYSYDQSTWTDGYSGALLTTDVRITSIVEEGIDYWFPLYARVRAKVGDVWTDWSTPTEGQLKYIWNGEVNKEMKLKRDLENA